MKKIQTETATICTTSGWLEEGCKYTYKEGGHRHPVILEEILENDEFLRLMLYFPDFDKHIEVSHRNDFQGGYMGMWRLWDYREEDYLPDEDDDRDPPVKEISFKPEITRESYINGLSYEQLGEIKEHFKTTAGVEKLGEREHRLTYLAWLVGEKHLLLGDGLTIFEMGKVEFNEQEYGEDLATLGVTNGDLDKLVETFQLDLLYKKVLKVSSGG